MQDFPHRYSATATAAIDDANTFLESNRLPNLITAPPAEFGGPGDRWSPETLLVGAIADCYILTFRAIARATRLPWTDLSCEVTGILDRIDRVAQFTQFIVLATLQVPAGTDTEAAERVLHRAESQCLVSNSLKGSLELHAEVILQPERESHAAPAATR